MKRIETSDSVAYIIWVILNILYAVYAVEHTLCRVCQDIDEDIYLSNWHREKVPRIGTSTYYTVPNYL